ncbi:MAG: hypothetical protein GC180_11035 [Bacteroidetes bacterium]|nr:hypothetical protein [Bacteroidota bacterium]
MQPDILHFIKHRPADKVPDSRLKQWQALAHAFQRDTSHPNLVFICTHNARRSIMSECLASALANQLGVEGIRFYSAGAEKTIVHQNTLTALEAIGFNINRENGVTCSFADDKSAIPLFSKSISDNILPSAYHAVLVCSDSDKSCPFVPAALSRTLLPFADPGKYDATRNAVTAYLGSARQIAHELRYFLQLLQ